MAVRIRVVRNAERFTSTSVELGRRREKQTQYISGRFVNGKSRRASPKRPLYSVQTPLLSLTLAFKSGYFNSRFRSRWDRLKTGWV